MDFKRCLEILELKNATSLNQVKQAYRELVHVWHPDRFSSNSRIKQRAEEKMKDALKEKANPIQNTIQLTNHQRRGQNTVKYI